MVVSARIDEVLEKGFANMDAGAHETVQAISKDLSDIRIYLARVDERLQNGARTFERIDQTFNRIDETMNKIKADFGTEIGAIKVNSAVHGTKISFGAAILGFFAGIGGALMKGLFHG